MTKCLCYSHNGLLTREGYRRVAQWRQEFLEGLEPAEAMCYIDSMVSVSALAEPDNIWDDAVIEQQILESQNGS